MGENYGEPVLRERVIAIIRDEWPPPGSLFWATAINAHICGCSGRYLAANPGPAPCGAARIVFM
jgi:hypothetical protein